MLTFNEDGEGSCSDKPSYINSIVLHIIGSDVGGRIRGNNQSSILVVNEELWQRWLGCLRIVDIEGIGLRIDEDIGHVGIDNVCIKYHDYIVREKSGCVEH